VGVIGIVIYKLNTPPDGNTPNKPDDLNKTNNKGKETPQDRIKSVDLNGNDNKGNNTPQDGPFKDEGEVSHELESFELLETSISQARKIVDRFKVSEKLQGRLSVDEFARKLANSMDLFFLNSLIKNRNPDETNSLNLEATKQIKLYLFRFLNLDDLKELLKESTKKTSIKSFNQMTTNEKFSFYLRLFKLAWKKYKLPSDDPLFKESIGLILNEYLDKISKFLPSDFSVSQLPDDVAILFPLGKLDSLELVKFSDYINSDDHTKLFKEKEGRYRSLSKSFKSNDDLDELNGLFRDLRALKLEYPESLKYYSFNYPILTDYHRKFVNSSHIDETAKFLNEPSPENLSSLVKKGAVKDDLGEIVNFFCSFYDKASEEYKKYQELIPLSKGTNINSSYDKIKTKFPDARLPDVLNINEPLSENLLNTLKSCVTIELQSKLYLFSDLLTDLGAYEMSPTEENDGTVRTKNLKALKVHLNFLEFPSRVGMLITSLQLYSLPQGFVNSKAMDKFYELCNKSGLVKPGPISLSQLKFMFNAWLESIADSIDDKYVAATTDEKKDYEKIINDSSKQLPPFKPYIKDDATYSSLVSKTENFSKEILETPANPKLLTEFFDFIHANNIPLGGYLDTACKGFIKVHLRSPETSSTAILFFLLGNLLQSYSALYNGKNSYNTAHHSINFEPAFEYNSMMLYLTQAWMEKKCNLKAADYSLFWKNFVYKYKLFMKLDVQIEETEKNHPALRSMDLSALTQESKVLLTEYFTMKELRSIVDFSSFAPICFETIQSLIPKSQELVKQINENLNFFEFKDNCFKSPKKPGLMDPYKEQYVYKVLMRDMVNKRYKSDPNFSENYTNHLKDYISKLEFKLTYLSEKHLTDTLLGLLDSIAPDFIPEYKPPFPFQSKS
jgi:hypothetical protein